MDNLSARIELCKMVNEISARLGIENSEWACTCGTGGHGHDRPVPDRAIAEMWRRLTHRCWSLRERFDAMPSAVPSKMILTKREYLDLMSWAKAVTAPASYIVGGDLDEV